MNLSVSSAPSAGDRVPLSRLKTTALHFLRLLTARPGIVAAAAALALIGVFTALLLPARHALRDEMQRTLIERAGAMLHPKDRKSVV